MKRALVYVLFALFAYGFFVLRQAPAELLWERVRNQINTLQASQLEGSVLYGKASAVRLQKLKFDLLEWRWQPWRLLLGHWSYQVNIVGPELNLTAQLSSNWKQELYLTALDANIPLQQLQLQLLALADNPVMPMLTGAVQIKFEQGRLDQHKRWHALQGQVRVDNASVQLSKQVALGDFNIEISSVEQALQAHMSDLAGGLVLDGQLNLTADGHYRISGLLGLRSNADPELGQWISLLGKPTAEGDWRFNFNGVLGNKFSE